MKLKLFPVLLAAAPCRCASVPRVDDSSRPARTGRPVSGMSTREFVCRSCRAIEMRSSPALSTTRATPSLQVDTHSLGPLKFNCTETAAVSSCAATCLSFVLHCREQGQHLPHLDLSVCMCETEETAHRLTPTGTSLMREEVENLIQVGSEPAATLRTSRRRFRTLTVQFQLLSSLFKDERRQKWLLQLFLATFIFKKEESS